MEKNERQNPFSNRKCSNWVGAFEIYAITSDSKKKKEPIQRATMLHCLGPAVQRIFNTLSGEHKTLEGVKTALDGFVRSEKQRSGRTLQIQIASTKSRRVYRRVSDDL